LIFLNFFCQEQIQEIKNTEKEISKQKKERRSWVTYRDRYRHDYDVHIKLLKQEIEDMINNYEIISCKLIMISLGYFKNLT
jgi:hypothetical protein